MKFSPSVVRGSSRQGVIRDITEQEIEQIFGFRPNVDDDPWKVVHSWSVDVSEVPGMFDDDTWTIHVWDYKNSHMFGQFSVCGDPSILDLVFGDRYEDESGEYPRWQRDCYN